MRPGTRIADRFLVEGFHAAGGMGRVYRAIDGETGGRVAIKVVDAFGAVDVARFQREVDTLTQLRHPGIVRYIAHGELERGERYLVAEWVEGALLSTQLESEGLSMAEGVQVVRGAADALAEAHRHSMIHRDIKPSNLILEGGRVDGVRILDFGIARFVDPEVRLTRTGTAVGTPGYMAPEQTLGHSDVDARVDVFSLGCVLYYCLSGFPPFAGSDVAAVRTKILLCSPPRLSAHCPEAPGALVELVHRMLANSPDRRPADASEVAAALAAIELPAAAGRVRRVAVLDAATRRHDSSVTHAASAAEEFVSLVFVRQLPGGVGAGSLEEKARELDPVGAGGAVFEAIGPNGLVARLAGPPSDTAARAAQAALVMARAIPTAGVAVCSGTAGEISALIDAGAATLESTMVELLFRAGDTPRIRIDTLTAELISDRFEVERVDDGLVLRSDDEGTG